MRPTAGLLAEARARLELKDALDPAVAVVATLNGGKDGAQQNKDTALLH